MYFPDDTIHLNGQCLSVVYDPPHLIKGVRNNFLTKNITMDGKTSKWQDLVDVYRTDCRHAQARLLHKLNDEHILPEKIKKMKVNSLLFFLLHRKKVLIVIGVSNNKKALKSNLLLTMFLFIY